MRKEFLKLLAILFFITSCSKKIDCSDFRTGRFFIPENKELLEFTSKIKDSISEFYIKRDPSIEKYIVIRNEKSQIEWVNGENIGDPFYEKIYWLNDCTYRLHYDEGKMELKESQKELNENGIIVEMISFQGNCANYIATHTSKSGEIITQKGTFCKE